MQAWPAPASVAYLQVEESNAPAIALYERLGYEEAYRYCHRVAPAGRLKASISPSITLGV